MKVFLTSKKEGSRDTITFNGVSRLCLTINQPEGTVEDSTVVYTFYFADGNLTEVNIDNWQISSIESEKNNE